MWVYKEKPYQYSLLKHLQEKGKARQGKARQGSHLVLWCFARLLITEKKNNNKGKIKQKQKHNYIAAKEVWNIFFSEVSNLNEIYN